MVVFFLWTAHGNSDSFYSVATDLEARELGNTYPYQGVCQDNGGGPALFFATSSPCMVYMHQKGFAVCIQSAFSSWIT
jgi:hypothetical protein